MSKLIKKKLIKRFFKIKYLLSFFLFILIVVPLFNELKDIKSRQDQLANTNKALLDESYKFRLFALELCQNSGELADYLLPKQDCSLLFSESELHKEEFNFEAFFIDTLDHFVISRDKHASLTAEVYRLSQDKKLLSGDDYLDTEMLMSKVKALLGDKKIEKYLAEQNLSLATSSENILELRREDALELRLFQERWKNYLSLEIGKEKVEKFNFNAFPKLLELAEENLASSSQSFDLAEFRLEAINDHQSENMQNILLLGKNAANVDTIMIASLDYANQKITLISIPRDLFYESRKINSIYHYFGMETFVEKISEISGLEIADYLLIDMLVFPDVVDALGGIDFVFEEALIDPFYKTIDDGKEGTLYYPQGETHLGGVESLRVARSRYTTSDFSRAARQQKLIKALADKLHEQKKGDILFKYIPMFLDKAETNLSLYKISKLFLNIKDFDIRIGSVISSGNVLDSKMYDLQSGKQMFILEPREGDWSLIKQYIGRELNK